jgi:hypothetical protein
MTHSPTLRTSRPSRHRASSVVRLAIAAALLVPTLAACAPDPEPGPASTRAAGASSASVVLGSCMREAGFDVPDEHFANTGVVAPPQGVDVEAYVEAFDECRETLPVDQGGGSQRPSPEDLAVLQEANLEVARCVRDKGFDDFPDPVDGQFPMEATSTSTDPSAVDAQTEAYFACDESFGPNSRQAGE